MNESNRPSTRDALIAGAQAVLADTGPGVPVSLITERAGVAVGSFYNHFASKDELFTAAAQTAFADFEDELVSRTAHIDAPAERLCTRTRLFCRIPSTHPTLARIVVNAAPWSLISPTGYSPAFAADAEQAAEMGVIDGADLSTKLLLIAAGAERIVARAIVLGDSTDHDKDAFVAIALQLLGVTREDARAMTAVPLEELVK